jgi:uncharacterized protein (TIGR03435 family)
MRAALLIAGMVVHAVAQDLPKFEVASVKASLWEEGEGCPQSMKMDRGRVDIACATVATLIGYAFRISPERVKGPAWMTNARFNIAAKIAPGGSINQVPEMVRALLEERFKLAVHRGNTREAIYALVVAKGGLKVKEAEQKAGGPDSDASPDAFDFFGAVQTSMDPGGSTATIRGPRIGTVLETEERDRIQQWHAPSISMAGLADLLDKVAPLSSPIIDMTGLPGRYQLVLEVSLKDLSRGEPSDMEATVLRGFNDGLRKLGLQLERRTGTMESLIVDHVEKTPAGN